MINEKNNSGLKNFEFRAVTMKRNREHIEYSSVPLQEAEGSYDTIGLYEVVENEGSSNREHVADMSIEDFTAVTNYRFPTDFDSWQQTHYEIIEHLITLTRLKPEEQPNFFRMLYSRLGKAVCFKMAKDWTDEFEKKNKNRHWEDDFLEEVEHFLQQKIKEEEQLYNPKSN